MATFDKELAARLYDRGVLPRHIALLCGVPFKTIHAFIESLRKAKP